MEQSNAAVVAAVCSMTSLQQFDWGLMSAAGSSVHPQQHIAFAPGPATTDLLSGMSSVSINKLVGHLNNRLPATRIRVFRIPSRPIATTPDSQ